MELRTDEKRRREMLRPVRALFFGATFGPPVLSLILMAVIPRHLYYGTPAAYLIGLGIVTFIPCLAIFGVYYADCSGSSKVQKVILYPEKLVFSGYSGKGFQQMQYLSVIDSIDSYKVGKRRIWINGRFKFTYTGKWNETSTKRHFSIMRTLEDEDKLLASLDALQRNKGGMEVCSR